MPTGPEGPPAVVAPCTTLPKRARGTSAHRRAIIVRASAAVPTKGNSCGAAGSRALPGAIAPTTQGSNRPGRPVPAAATQTGGVDATTGSVHDSTSRGGAAARRLPPRKGRRRPAPAAARCARSWRRRGKMQAWTLATGSVHSRSSWGGVAARCAAPWAGRRAAAPPPAAARCVRSRPRQDKQQMSTPRMRSVHNSASGGDVAARRRPHRSGRRRAAPQPPSARDPGGCEANSSRQCQGGRASTVAATAARRPPNTGRPERVGGRRSALPQPPGACGPGRGNKNSRRRRQQQGASSTAPEGATRPPAAGRHEGGRRRPAPAAAGRARSLRRRGKLQASTPTAGSVYIRGSGGDAAAHRAALRAGRGWRRPPRSHPARAIPAAA